MTAHREHGVDLARSIAVDLARYAKPLETAEHPAGTVPKVQSDDTLEAFDRRILDDGLIAATRSRFESSHYADSVEAAVKALCECVRQRSGSDEDGDGLMTSVFSVNQPKLRINRLRSQTDKSAQRGHMSLCQGVVAAWRNPRAHQLLEDSPVRALMMIELIQDLMAVTKSATRTRKKKSSS